MGDGSSGRLDAKGKGRATPNNGMLALDLDSAEGGMSAPNGGGGAFQQMELVEQQVRPCASPMRIALTCSHRTVTFSLAPQLSSRSRLRSRSLARSSISSRTWSQSNARRSSGSTPIHSTLRPTSEARSASYSSIMQAFRATGGSCSKSLVSSLFS